MVFYSFLVFALLLTLALAVTIPEIATNSTQETKSIYSVLTEWLMGVRVALL